MTIWEVIIISIVEGVTEFLPISSTGHMIVVASFLGMEQTVLLKVFEVVIQVGAIAAVVFYYRKKIIAAPHILGKACLAFAPMGFVGLIWAQQIKSLFSVTVVAWMFIIGGIVFFATEYFYRQKPREELDDVNVSDVSLKSVMLVGVAQVFALVPGTSRSGATIVGGMLTGLSRQTATELSFMLAIPAMIVVTIYDLVAHPEVLVADGTMLLFVVGLIVAFVVAYGSVHFLVRYVARYSFVPFGIYRILFGLGLLFFAV